VVKSEIVLVRMGFAAGFAVLFLGGIRLQRLHEFLWFAPAVAGLWATLEVVVVRTRSQVAAEPIAEPAGEFRVRISPPASAPS